MRVENEKASWLQITLVYFKSTGKYYSEDTVYIPNILSTYDRRVYLEKHIESIDGNAPFTYVSLDSNVLGFPFLRPAKEDWYKHT